MTNEELMQLMTEMGLHEGGMENWVPDNAWLLVANRAIEIEREACAKLCDELETCSDAEFYGHEFAAAIRARGNVREHTMSGDCWCNPELNYTDPETGTEVWVHKEPQ